MSDCTHPNPRVRDSRPVVIDGTTTVRRRRKCPDCGHRWTTYELEREFLARLVRSVHEAALVRGVEALQNVIPLEAQRFTARWLGED